jgi:hypothetical protein
MAKTREQCPSYMLAENGLFACGRTLYVYVHHRGAATVTVEVYLIFADAHPEIRNVNTYLARFCGYRLDKDERLLVNNQGGLAIEEQIAEYAGRVLHGDEHAFACERLR